MSIKEFRDRYHLKPVIVFFAYILIPVTAINVIEEQYPLLESERFEVMKVWIPMIGFLILCITILQERYRKGEFTRLMLDLAYVSLSIVWLFVFLGGRFVLRDTYDGYDFQIDITLFVSIILALTSLNYVHDILEYLYFKESRVKQEHGFSLPCKLQSR